MEQKRFPISWAFWFQWVLANGVGWIVGMSLTIYIGALLEEFTQGALTILLWAILSLVAGISLGVNQWFVLRLFALPRQGAWLKWWVVITTLAWAPSLVTIVALGVGEQMNFAISGAIIGMTMGIAQYFVLNNQVKRAEWWAIANTLGWMAGLGLIDVINQVVGYLLAGLISGIVTGIFLVWLLKQAQEAEKAAAESQ